MNDNNTIYKPFKVGKKKKFTLGRRQTERVDIVCNKLGMTPEQIIKVEMAKQSALL